MDAGSVVTLPPSVRSLAEIAATAGSDKLEHHYISFYDDLFSGRRDREVRLLEVGVGGFERPNDPSFGGHSLRMWAEYFSSGRIVGLDILDKSACSSARIEIVHGSQNDRALLEALSINSGPFDIIIDDGSHVPQHAIGTFEMLFPLLAENGIYVIEDIQTSYWPHWGGKYRRSARNSSMGYVKRRIDGLNWAEFRLPRFSPTYFDLNICEVRSRHNIVAFLKGPNVTPSNMNFAHPEPLGRWIAREFIPVAVRKAKGGLRRAAGKVVPRRVRSGRGLGSAVSSSGESPTVA